jgi:hypothetical protein
MILRSIALALVGAACIATAASAAELVVKNNSKVDITELKVAPSSDADWSSLDDVLKGVKIPAGGSGTVTGIDPGKWDFQVTDAEGKSCEVLNVTISEGAEWDIGDGDIASCE